MNFKPKQTNEKPEGTYILKAEYQVFSLNCFKNFQPAKIL